MRRRAARKFLAPRLRTGPSLSHSEKLSFPGLDPFAAEIDIVRPVSPLVAVARCARLLKAWLDADHAVSERAPSLGRPGELQQGGNAEGECQIRWRYGRTGRQRGRSVAGS